ncbi:recombinase family protein [Legionella nagasakiensis]|uniref:recombinase family protein n=1 Tax=Legionella nagasakiensis TaxID=535290 RepID=UPI001F5FCA04|nr:recombinase family protein [Legionella nagasakiensis]
MIYGYVRVSTQEQNVDSQKNIISRYCVDQKMMVDEWIVLEMSSRKSTSLRRIDELLNKLQHGDIIIAYELSRLGRSIKETLNTIETIIQEKQARLILIKQNLDLNPTAKNHITNKVLITIFSMLAELERDFISERTKEGLRARVAKGINQVNRRESSRHPCMIKTRKKFCISTNLVCPFKKLSIPTWAMVNIYRLKPISIKLKGKYEL